MNKRSLLDKTIDALNEYRITYIGSYLYYEPNDDKFHIVLKHYPLEDFIY